MKERINYPNSEVKETQSIEDCFEHLLKNR